MLPLAGRTAQSLARWLEPAWEGGRDGPETPSSGAARHLLPRGEKGERGPLRLVPDLDRVDALASERRDLWSRIGAAGFLTDDEKRAAVGYGPRGGEGKANEIVVTALRHWERQPRVPAGSSQGGEWTAFLGGVAELGDTFFSTLFNVTDASAGALIRAVLERTIAAIKAIPSLRASAPPPASGIGRAPPGVKPSRDILQPGGGSDPKIRTVTDGEFRRLQDELMRDARPVKGPSDYRGPVYERPDGLRFGVRRSID